MGVITTGLLAAGKVFGPIPSNLGLADPAYLIGHMTCDNRPDVHTVKLDLNEYMDSSRAGEWVPYVQASRDEQEQNLEAVLLSGSLHYRVLRTVPPGTEVLVWYDRELAAALAIPELQPFHIKEGGIYQCPYCMENFRYPNSLRAHMRFKCSQRRPSPSMEGSVAPKLAQEHQERLLAAYRFPYMMHPGRGNAAFYPYPGMLAGQVPSFTEASLMALPSSASSTSSGLSPSTAVSTADRGTRITPEKRSLEDDAGSSPPAKRLSLEASPVSPRSSPRSSPHATSSASPASPVQHRTTLDQNQNVHDVKEEEETVSAFRKVEKQIRRHSPPLVSHSGSTDKPYDTNLPPGHPANIFTSRALTEATDSLKSLPPGAHPSSFIPPYPMIPRSVIPPPLVPPTNYSENVPLNIADIYRNNLKMNDMPRLSDKLTEIRNLENNNIAMKLPFMGRGGMTPLPMQYYKSNNPMVDKLLNSNLPVMPTAITQLNLLQNWCAKCNATFRMTSDLVYHMRSHHHLPKDPVKAKREEKLKCTICGETFRERHHLTRHMTSHT